MSYQLRFTDEALEDLDRLYDYLIAYDLDLADRAYDAIMKALVVFEEFPFSCRKASADNTLMRELLVPFGSSGYVVLFHIDGSQAVTIAAIRHQREDDYH